MSILSGFVDNVSSKFLNPNTEKIILTKATINTLPKGYLSGSNDSGGYMNLTFKYMLELNKNGELIDGKWYYPFPEKDLGFKQRWFHVIKPTGIFYPDEVSLPAVGELASFFSKLRR